MRIVGGKFKGRRLAAVPGKGTRPTADRVREALFNRLLVRYELEGASLLDLFAGSGALGLEALSRGAAELLSVERDHGAVGVIEANLERCGLRADGTRADGLQAEVLRAEVAATLGRLAREGRVFDGVFVDPPYAGPLALETLETLGGLELLGPSGWVSVETDRQAGLPDSTGSLLLVRRDDYGDTALWLYEVGARRQGSQA